MSLSSASGPSNSDKAISGWQHYGSRRCSDCSLQDIGQYLEEKGGNPQSWMGPRTAPGAWTDLQTRVKKKFLETDMT